MWRFVIILVVAAVALTLLTAAPVEACGDCYYTVGMFICVSEWPGWRICMIGYCDYQGEWEECCIRRSPCLWT